MPGCTTGTGALLRSNEHVQPSAFSFPVTVTYPFIQHLARRRDRDSVCVHQRTNDMGRLIRFETLWRNLTTSGRSWGGGFCFLLGCSVDEQN